MDDEELYIKSRDLCERCAFGDCPARNCEKCGAFVPWNADGSLAGCGCALVDDRMPCPYFREKTEPGFRQKATLKARCAG